METIGIGIIGCDDMGRHLAISAHAVEGLEVICVSDSQEALSEKLAADLNVSWTSDYRELLSDDRVHVVLIATSPSQQIVTDTVAAGKYNFHSIAPLDTKGIQQMLIEHLLPPEEFFDNLRNT